MAIFENNRSIYGKLFGHLETDKIENDDIEAGENFVTINGHSVFDIAYARRFMCMARGQNIRLTMWYSPTMTAEGDEDTITENLSNVEALWNTRSYDIGTTTAKSTVPIEIPNIRLYAVRGVAISYSKRNTGLTANIWLKAGWVSL